MKFGVELEYGDIDRSIELPNGNTYDNRDYDIVSSNGWAVDPKGKLHTIGGEINTIPVDNLEDFRSNIEDINNTLQNQTTNYRCHTHIHVSDDRLLEPEGLKQFIDYLYKNQREFRDTIYSIKSQPDVPRSMNIFQRANCLLMPERVYNAIMEAETMKEIQRGFGRRHDGGFWEWLTRRYGINAYSIFKMNRGTIEFRTFKGSTDPEILTNCAKVCKEFVEHALTDQTPFREWYREVELPKQLPVDLYIEYGYQRTNHKTKHKLSLEEIEENLYNLPTREEFENNRELYLEGFKKWKA